MSLKLSSSSKPVTLVDLFVDLQPLEIQNLIDREFIEKLYFAFNIFVDHMLEVLFQLQLSIFKSISEQSILASVLRLLSNLNHFNELPANTIKQHRIDTLLEVIEQQVSDWSSSADKVGSSRTIKDVAKQLKGVWIRSIKTVGNVYVRTLERSPT